MVSAVLRPRVDPSQWGWLPLLTAVAVADVVGFAGVARPEVKWPNDVLVGGRKVAGVLCEVVPEDAPAAGDRSGPAVVAGWGLNVSQSVDELPHAGATSLLLEGAQTDRAALLRHALHRWSHWYHRWETGDASGVREAYESCSSTLGTRVLAALPDGRSLEGTAVALAEGGGLVVRVGGDEVVVAAADVVHLR
jgi:BirA family biotin operon repressor/biotin-[acetyl-CoA-carboxylase] ligase